MSEWAAKRFWKATDVVSDEAGFSVTLDGRAVKTPLKAPLVLPSQEMAQAIALEWDAQDGVIDPTSMPVTRSANAAIDKVSLQHGDVVDMLAAYAETDLLCHRADGPEALVARQLMPKLTFCATVQMALRHWLPVSISIGSRSWIGGRRPIARHWS